MDLDDIKNLIEFLKETDITELQFEQEGSKIRIKREKLFPPLDISTHKTPVVQDSVVMEAEDETQRMVTVTSPIVGTFYRSPSPDAQPFVETGSRVKKGQVLCIIEAMKLMNEIESDADGIIVKVLIENGQPVEYGEPLFLIEPL